MKHLDSTRRSDLSQRAKSASLPREPRKRFAPAGAIEGEAIPLLQGKTIVNLFFENSTRTRTSFELATRRLGGSSPELRGLNLERAKRRNPDRYRPQHRSDEGRTASSCATLRPEAPSVLARSLERSGRQRGRRLSRASDAGPARRLHDPRKARHDRGQDAS